ncbi:hypothetical protein TeGR_g3698, partial [Tetraparma gracilis]
MFASTSPLGEPPAPNRTSPVPPATPQDEYSDCPSPFPSSPLLPSTPTPPSTLSALSSRLANLESLLASQQLAIARLRRSNEELLGVIRDNLSRWIEDAIDDLEAGAGSENPGASDAVAASAASAAASALPPPPDSASPKLTSYEYLASSEIFGPAPSSVTDAADAAGTSVLSAMLGGLRRMVVDVRDAELASNPKTLTQFIELSILPVAAGLEGLRAERNRVKLVFPTVARLMEYRRHCSLAAPDVISLGTLAFGSVEPADALVVILAPHPDDEEEMSALRELLAPGDPARRIEQPVVVVNRHMRPPDAGEVWGGDWEVVYHLRLLSIQYMQGEVLGASGGEGGGGGGLEGALEG